jgi:hypothetical protein
MRPRAGHSNAKYQKGGQSPVPVRKPGAPCLHFTPAAAPGNPVHLKQATECEGRVFADLSDRGGMICRLPLPSVLERNGPQGQARQFFLERLQLPLVLLPLGLFEAVILVELP